MKKLEIRFKDRRKRKLVVFVKSEKDEKIFFKEIKWHSLFDITSTRFNPVVPSQVIFP